MDEISQDLKLSFGFPCGRWIDVRTVDGASAGTAAAPGRGPKRRPAARQVKATTMTLCPRVNPEAQRKP